MSGTTVRPLRGDDEPAVAALWDRVFPDARRWNRGRAILERKRAVGDGLWWVAEQEGHIVGAVLAGWDGQRGWVYHLAVDPERRRRGVGRALVTAVEATLAARGCPKVNLQVLAPDREAVRFYEAIGWQVEERVSMGKALLPPDGERAEAPSSEEEEAGGACSFCGKSLHEVHMLVAGPTALICEECVEVCNEIIAEGCVAAEPAEPPEGAPAPAAPVLCLVCRLARPVEDAVLVPGRGSICPTCLDDVAALVGMRRS